MGVRIKGCFVGLLLISSGLAAATTENSAPTPARMSSLRDALARYEQNWAAAMAAPVERVGAERTPAPSGPEKYAQRCRCLQQFDEWQRHVDVRPLAAPDQYNQIENFFGPEFRRPLLRTLSEMDDLKLHQSYLSETPWAGDFFAIAKGILAGRPFDREFLKLKNWQERYAYIQEHPFAPIFAAQDPGAIAQLAIAEKYDLLLGDLSGGLSQGMWREGQIYFEKDGKVEDWMGICHGWAPASISVPRPERAATLLAYDGKTPLTFFPAEIKGLISQQWAVNPFPVRFLGQRCNAKDPQKDANGRIIEPGCFDLNPATWHMVTVNRLGQQGKSFVFDATYDYEVWNQPLYGYQYVYFDPRKMEPAADLNSAKVALADFPEDKFKAYRHPAATHVVGIAMTVGYVIESAVNQLPEDSPDFDTLSWARYIYDLELDEQGQIIGGEWYSQRHPDFLWTPAPGALARSPVDDRIDPEAWRPGEAVPKEWLGVAKRVSPYGVVLGPVISRLHELSRRRE